MLQAVDDYCADAQLDKNERQSVRQQVYSYCNEQLQAGEEIELQALSQELSPVGEKDFMQFSSEQGYELEESFPADRGNAAPADQICRQRRRHQPELRCHAAGRAHFLGCATDTLTIKGTPPNLRDQLQRRAGSGK